ncbi:hypothetical protein I6E06_06335 [Bifidobacterium boum]|nr:hypothetical protein [Bifidobacterium boum]
MVYEFDRTKHEKLRDMQAARRAKHPGLMRGDMNFTQASHAAGVSKRAGKAWHNSRTRSTGRNERPLSDRYRGGMDPPEPTRGIRHRRPTDPPAENGSYTPPEMGS